MLTLKKWRVAGAVVSTAMIGAGIAAAVAGPTPAGAATTPGWHQVFSHRYGPATDYSGFMTAVALGTSNVWVLGGSNISSDSGGQPVIVQWRGNGWTGNVAPAGLTSRVQAASADSASDIWAVTFTGDVLHYNGAKWTIVKRQINPGGVATGVTALSPKNVWVFGNTGYGPGVGTWHFDGITWRHETTFATGGNIGVASAVSASNIWGFGASTVSPSAQVGHFNGTTWTTVTDPKLTGLLFDGVHAFSASNVWVTANSQGSAGPSYLLNYTNHWAKVTIPWGVQVTSGVTSDGRTGLWFTATDSAQRLWEVHWYPGNKWQRSLSGSNTHIGNGLVNIPGTTSIVAPGYAFVAPASNASVWVLGSI